jgi:hypothetical protein
MLIFEWSSLTDFEMKYASEPALVMTERLQTVDFWVLMG